MSSTSRPRARLRVIARPGGDEGEGGGPEGLDELEELVGAEVELRVAEAHALGADQLVRVGPAALPLIGHRQAEQVAVEGQ